VCKEFASLNWLETGFWLDFLKNAAKPGMAGGAAKRTGLWFRIRLPETKSLNGLAA